MSQNIQHLTSQMFMSRHTTIDGHHSDGRSDFKSRMIPGTIKEFVINTIHLKTVYGDDWRQKARVAHIGERPLSSIGSRVS